MIEPICTVEGIDVFQDPQAFKSGQAGRVHYVADMSVDVDGAEKSYRLDNSREKGALDDITHSAGYPDSSWWNVLVRDPKNPDRPYVDENGFCVSMTSYQRLGFSSLDRSRYLDSVTIPYAVPPGKVRKLCCGVLLGCRARITDVVNSRFIECVTSDFSGNRIGESSLFAARFFDLKLSARNGDGRNRYLYEYWPGVPAVINGETFRLIPA